jgi:hypothetical protein
VLSHAMHFIHHLLRLKKKCLSFYVPLDGFWLNSIAIAAVKLPRVLGIVGLIDDTCSETHAL